MEPGLVTLSKIVGLLLVCIAAIPMVFLLAPGTEPGEPKHNPIDPDREHH
jgi:hypothetical protein